MGTSIGTCARPPTDLSAHGNNVDVDLKHRDVHAPAQQSTADLHKAGAMRTREGLVLPLAVLLHSWPVCIGAGADTAERKPGLATFHLCIGLAGV